MKKTVGLVFDYALFAILALAMAINYEILIFGNAFAPAGINGLATIIQHVFNFSVGYMSLLINIPLLIVAFIIVDKRFAVKTAIYVITFSVCVLIFKNGEGDAEGFIDLSRFAYVTEVSSKILAPVAAGTIAGLVYGVLIRRNGCTGGTDIIARLVQVKRPYLNIFAIMFLLNSTVAILSFFAYAENGKYNIEPVILCLIYSFVSSRVGDVVIQGHKSALKFEVVTSHPDEISEEIINKLNHTATVVRATGMFSHTDKSLLICVVHRSQIAEFEKIVKNYQGTFTYLSPVNEIVGNFVAPVKKGKGDL